MVYRSVSNILKLKNVTVLIVTLMLSGCLSSIDGNGICDYDGGEYSESMQLRLDVLAGDLREDYTQGPANGSWELWISAPEFDTNDHLLSFTGLDSDVLRIEVLPTNSSWVDEGYLENSTDGTTTFVVISGNGSMAKSWTLAINSTGERLDPVWDGRNVDVYVKSPSVTYFDTSPVMLYGDDLNESTVQFSFTFSGEWDNVCEGGSDSRGFQSQDVDKNSIAGETTFVKTVHWAA